MRDSMVAARQVVVAGPSGPQRQWVVARNRRNSMGIQGALAIGALAVGVLFSTARAAAAVPEQVLALDPALGQLPESMAIDDHGNFYLSMGSQVAKVSSSLAVTTLATLPIPAGGFATGVKFGPRGDLFV